MSRKHLQKQRVHSRWSETALWEVSGLVRPECRAANFRMRRRLGAIAATARRLHPRIGTSGPGRFRNQQVCWGAVLARNPVG